MNPKVSQETMARHLGITLRHYAGLEDGSRTPSLKLASAIKDEFGIAASDWIESKGKTDDWIAP